MEMFILILIMIMAALVITNFRVIYVYLCFTLGSFLVDILKQLRVVFKKIKGKK